MYNNKNKYITYRFTLEFRIKINYFLIAIAMAGIYLISNYLSTL